MIKSQTNFIAIIVNLIWITYHIKELLKININSRNFSHMSTEKELGTKAFTSKDFDKAI